MADYILSCCSTADLTEKHFNERDIRYICFHYYLDGKPYPDDLGKTIPFDKFYRMMAEGADTSTSQINSDEFIDYFTPFLKEGKDILHVTLSSGLSGVYNSACVARDELAKEYPERKILIVDSLAASSGYGLFMDKLADLRDQGMDIESLAKWAEDNRHYVNHWFFSTDLTFYVKGGRVSKASGWFGTVLHICPLLHVDAAGKLIPKKKARGKKNVKKEIVERMEKFAENGLDYSGKCYMCHSACFQDARDVADAIESEFKKLSGPVEIYDIGTTIGSHTGPGTVAVFFWGAHRLEQ